MLTLVVDMRIGNQFTEETNEPLVGELVHWVQLEEVIRDKEKLCSSLRDWLVHFRSLHEQLHRIVDLQQGLSGLLCYCSTFHELLDQKFFFYEHIERLWFLKLFQDVILNCLESFDPNQGLSSKNSLFGILLSFELR